MKIAGDLRPQASFKMDCRVSLVAVFRAVSNVKRLRMPHTLCYCELVDVNRCGRRLFCVRMVLSVLMRPPCRFTTSPPPKRGEACGANCFLFQVFFVAKRPLRSLGEMSRSDRGVFLKGNQNRF